MKKVSFSTTAVVAAVLAFLFSVSASTQTLSLNDSVIVRSTTNPVGVNLGVINDWANGQILKGSNGSPDKTGANPANTTVLRDEVVAALQSYFGSSSRNNPGILRYSLNGNKGTLSNWTEPDHAHRLAGLKTGSFSTLGGDEAVNLSLQDFLAICQYLKVEPYLELPATIFAADTANLVEFLAGPSSTPYGGKRAALGQEEPWSNVFSNIHLSLCDECGNALSLPGQAFADRSSQTEGEHLSDFSNRARDIFAAVRADSYYSESSFDLVMSVPSTFNSSIEIAVERAHPDSIEIHDYAHFAMNGLTSDTSLAQAATVEPFEKVTSPLDPFNLYQSVPSYQSLTTCGASESATCKVNIYGSSQGATNGNTESGEGVIVALQSLMNMQYYVIGPQSVSTFANRANGGGAKQKAVTYNSDSAAIGLPTTYLGLQLINQSIIGPMFSCPIANNLTYDFAGSANGSYSIPAVQSVPYLYAFCFENGTKRSLVLINTDLTKNHTLSFGGSSPPSGSVTQRQYAPASLNGMNESPAGQNSSGASATVAIETSTLSSPGSITLPPYSVTALDYTAASEPDVAPASAEASTIAAVLPAAGSSPAAETNPTTQAATTGTPVINCPSGFSASGSCSVSASTGGSTTFFSTNASKGGSALSGSSQIIVPTGCDHCGYANNAQTAVNIQAFTMTWTFVPNEYNGFVEFQNNQNSDASYFLCSGTNCAFGAGAGYEGGFFQAFSSNGKSTDHLFGLEFYDNHSFASCTTITCSGATYTGSTAQIYQAQQPPYNPNYGTETWYWTTDKISTSPVQFSSPSNSQQTTTRDTYSATLTYDGTTLTYDVYDVTAGGTCTPTTSGTCFSQSWANVNIPSIVGSNTAYLGISGGSNAASVNPYYLNSLVYTVNTPPANQSHSSYTSQSYTGSPYVAAPTFSPAAGTYAGTQNVTVSSTTPGAYYCYTLSATTPSFLPQTDNSGGCTEGTLYSGAVAVSSSQTLYVMGGENVNAAKNYYLPSNLVTASYTIGGSQATAPSCTPASGNSSSPITVTCTNSNSGTTIMCYTENGATPVTNRAGTGCTTGTALSGTSGNITISSTTAKLNVVAGTSTLSDSTVSSYGAYTISTVLPTPTFSVAAGTYATSQSVAISDSTSGTTIYYTTNGTAPSTSSSVYTGPITVSSTETLEAIAVETGDTNSAAASAAYTITPAVPAPTFSPASGTYTSSQLVTISETTSGTTIYYTTNGTTPTSSSTVYTGPITVSSTETLEAIAIVTGDSNAVGMATYTIAPVLPAPAFSLAAGTYATTQTVSISDATAGTTIYYTTNGTAPTTSSTVYSGPITVSASETLEAIAVKTGYTNSPPSTAVYTIAPVLPAPAFSLAAGTYATTQTVSISDATAGTAIYYTTNGTAPTTSSTVYSGPITVSASETLEAIAVKTGYTNSPAATAVYTISTASTTYISYPSGGFTSGSLHLNGGTTVTTGGLLQLTDGGANEGRSAWFTTEVPVQTFVTDFTFQQLKANADGMTFTIQSQGTTALGQTGGSLGYQGITPSVAVKFDLFSNGGEGPDSTGLYTDGASPTTPAVNLSTTGINLHSGDIMDAHVVYDGTNLTMTLTDTVTLAFVTEVFPVNIPSLLGANTAYVGFTGGTGGETATQNVLTWSYMSPAVVPAAAPTFSPGPGTYATSQTVTISDSIAGTTIYYTTNGTAPSTSSSVYTGPITVSSTETLEAIAVETGDTNSAAASAAYTITPAVPAPTFSPASGTYTSSQLVTISETTSGTTIYYTTNGTTPTSSSTVYTGPITVSSTETLEAIAIVTGDSNAVGMATYTIAPVLPAPAFSLAAGTYATTQTVSISDATAGTTIYYTTNGTTPTTSSSVYSGPITVSASETLQAIAVETGYSNSAAATAAYTIAPVLPAPAFSLATGTYTSSQSVSISDATAGTTIYYTTNGTTPTTSSTVYTGPITVSASERLEAIAVETGYTNSAATTAAYTIAPVLPAPAFSLTAGAYTTAQSVSISDATAGTTIYYTTNGTTPTTSSSVYSGPITVSASETLQAIAVETGYSNSAAATAAYTIAPVLPAPAFSLTAGAYTTAQSVSISDATAGTTIYYTTNGTTPTTSSSVYSGPITVSASETLQAIAVETGYSNSAAATAAYTIASGSTAQAVLINPAPGSVLGLSTNFTWSAGTGVTQYVLWLGTTSGASDLYYSGCLKATSTTAAVPMNGATVYAELWSEINGTWQGTTYTFTEGAGGATPTPAVLTSPAPGGVLGLSTTFTWSAGAGVTQYVLWLGTTSGASDLYYSGCLKATSTTAAVPMNGATVYAELWSEINGTWQGTTYTFTEGVGGATPTPAVLTSPAPGGVLGLSTTFTWSAGAGVTQYVLWLGTTSGASDLYYSGCLTATSTTAAVPMNGATVYAELWSEINGTWQGTTYTFTEGVGGATPTPAVLTSPAPGGVLGLSTNFTWSAGAGVTQYILWLGTTSGASDLYNSGCLKATSTTAAVPMNGTTVYAELWSEINGTWQGTTYTFTEGQ